MGNIHGEILTTDMGSRHVERERERERERENMQQCLIAISLTFCIGFKCSEFDLPAG